MMQYSRLGNNYILLLSFLLLSFAMPARFTSSRRPSQVSVGDALFLKQSFSTEDFPTGTPIWRMQGCLSTQFPVSSGPCWPLALSSLFSFLIIPCARRTSVGLSL